VRRSSQGRKRTAKAKKKVADAVKRGNAEREPGEWDRERLRGDDLSWLAAWPFSASIPDGHHLPIRRISPGGP